MTENKTHLLQKSEPYSKTDEYAVIKKYGTGFKTFLDTFPTLQNRTLHFASVYDAVSRGGMSLAGIDGAFGSGASEYWLKCMLVEMFTFLGAIDVVTTYQTKTIAARIRQKYFYLTPAELTYFFYAYPFGDYGTLFVGKTVNPQNVLEGLGKYAKEVHEKRTVVEEEQAEEHRRMQEEEDRKHAVSWEQFCEMTGREKTKSPLEVLWRKALKDSNRAENEQ